jgi:mRNA-degrading endonuclease RelE of RelBE toxin-antitoxin system
MNWSVFQTKRFSRQYKKLHDNIAVDVDAAIDHVQQNPEIGDSKKGDLATLRVFKFRSDGQLYLLGYTLDDTVWLVYLESVGSHENVYRDLKRHL